MFFVGNSSIIRNLEVVISHEESTTYIKWSILCVGLWLIVFFIFSFSLSFPAGSSVY